MLCFRQYIALVVTSAIVVSLSSCATPVNHQSPTPTASAANREASPPSPSTTQTLNTVDTQATSTPTKKNTATVTIYHADNRCETLVPEKVTLPIANQVEAAVGKVLAQEDTADLRVAGYRISINSTTGVAIVDLRISPDSKLKLTSLSNCQQFALFGSLQKSLTSNPAWKIKDVRFTQQGKELFF